MWYLLHAMLNHSLSYGDPSNASNIAENCVKTER